MAGGQMRGAAGSLTKVAVAPFVNLRRAGRVLKSTASWDAPDATPGQPLFHTPEC